MHNDPAWNCRNWIVEAIRELRTEQRESQDNGHEPPVVIDEDYSQQQVKNTLSEDRELWEQGEHHFFERTILEELQRYVRFIVLEQHRH